MCLGPFFHCTIKALVLMEHGASQAKTQSFVLLHSRSFDENDNNSYEHLWCQYFINHSEECSWGRLGRIMKSKARLGTVLTWCHLNRLGHADHEIDSAPYSAHWGISVKGYFVVVLGIKKKWSGTQRYWCACDLHLLIGFPGCSAICTHRPTVQPH